MNKEEVTAREFDEYLLSLGVSASVAAGILVKFYNMSTTEMRSWADQHKGESNGGEKTREYASYGTQLYRRLFH